MLATFGNHDPLDLLAKTRNRDGSNVLLGQGETRNVKDLILASIGGIWAKSHRLPHYVTDQDVARYAHEIAAAGPVNILLTHACPIGLADLTATGRHGGQRCFLHAFNTIAPRLHCCGHLHVPQEKSLRDGRKVINVGATPQGSIAVVDFDTTTHTLISRLETVARRTDRMIGASSRIFSQVVAVAPAFPAFNCGRYTRFVFLLDREDAGLRASVSQRNRPAESGPRGEPSRYDVKITALSELFS